MVTVYTLLWSCCYNKHQAESERAYLFTGRLMFDSQMTNKPSKILLLTYYSSSLSSTVLPAIQGSTFGEGSAFDSDRKLLLLLKTL